MTGDDVKKLLGLAPHPREGGWYVRTWESSEFVGSESFVDSSTGSRYAGPRRTSTAIYYLLEPDTFSEMHVLQSDEVFHHYLGDAVEMLQLHPDGNSEVVLLGKDLAAGERPQAVVPRGVWQGSRLAACGSAASEGFALLGCTVSPGFEFEDYASAEAVELIAKWPQAEAMILALTRT